MKAIILSIVVLTLVLGAYLNRNKPEAKTSTQVMIEDTVETSLAAPVVPELPL